MAILFMIVVFIVDYASLNGFRPQVVNKKSAWHRCHLVRQRVLSFRRFAIKSEISQLQKSKYDTYLERAKLYVADQHTASRLAFDLFDMEKEKEKEKEAALLNATFKVQKEIIQDSARSRLSALSIR